jgi:FkbM family methyltransferase
MPDFLASCLTNDHLKCIDVGARGGLQGPWKRFAPLIDLDAFEPDAAACEQQKAKNLPNEHWFPVALGAETGTAKLFVLEKASGSSLYPPNSDVNNAYAPKGYGRLNKVIDVPVLGFSDFITRYQRPLPNLIKLDTQGSELDILKSLGVEHWKDLIAVQVEVEFIEYYLGQPLFDQVDAFMRAQGFALYDLLAQRMYRVADEQELYYVKKHLGIVKRRQDISARMVAGDAFYMRPPEQILAHGSRQDLIKSFLVLVIYRFLDEALWLTEEAEKLGKLTREEATALIAEVKAVAPRPRLVQRSDLLGRLARKFTKATRIGRARKIEYWLDRSWDW